MSEIVIARNDASHRKLSKKFALTLPSFSSRIIAQSDSLTKYEASAQRRIIASASAAASADKSSLSPSGQTGTSSVDSNNNDCRSQSSSHERAAANADDHDSNRQQVKKKKSFAKKKKTKKPHSREGKEVTCNEENPIATSSNSLQLENEYRAITPTNAIDQTSETESNASSRASLLHSDDVIPLGLTSQHPKSALDGVQSSPICVQQHPSNKMASCDETLKPPVDWHTHNDCSEMQPTKTDRTHKSDAVGKQKITSEEINSSMEFLLPSAFVPPVPVLSVSVPAVAAVPSVPVSLVVVSPVAVPTVHVPSVSVPPVPASPIVVPPVAVPAIPPSVPGPSISIPSVSVPPIAVSPVPVPQVFVLAASVPSASVPPASVPPVSAPPVSAPSIADPPVAGLEKSRKDLQRQMFLLHKLTPILNDQMEKSLKSITTTFQELHNRLNLRETKLICELNEVTSQANAVLCEQKMKGEQLRCEIQQLMQPSDSDVAQLKSLIKEYVSKRRIYEEMSERHRFIFDWTNLLKDIDTFGEIASLEVAESLILNGSCSTQSTVNHLEAATHAIAPTTSTSTDDGYETSSPNHTVIQVWPIPEDQSPLETPLSDGEHLRKERKDSLPLAEGLVHSFAEGVTVQVEPGHQKTQQNGIDDVLSSTVAVNEISASKESARLDWSEEEVIQSHDPSYDLNSRPSINSSVPSADKNDSSRVEINIVGSKKERNLNDVHSVDLRLSTDSFKDTNSPKNLNSPNDLVNCCPLSNGTHSTQMRSSDTKTVVGPTDSMHHSQPLKQTLGDSGRIEFKSENNAEGKHRLPQQKQRMMGNLSDGSHSVIGFLTSNRAELKGSSLVLPLQFSNADNFIMTNEQSEEVSSPCTEPGETTEQKENVGNRNKKKRKKKKSKNNSADKMDDTIQDDNASSVSDSSRNSEATIQQKKDKQPTHLKVTEQNQPIISAEVDAVTVPNKRGSTKKRKKYPSKKYTDEENSLSFTNILGEHNGLSGVTSPPVLSTKPDKQSRASQLSDTCLQKQNCAIKMGKPFDRSSVRKFREDSGEENKTVAEMNIDRNSRRYEDAIDTFNRKIFHKA